MKLTDTELLIMNYLWNQGESKANKIAEYFILEKEWKKNTTYTLINRLVKKGAIKRDDPGFICYPLIEMNDVRMKETKSLLNKIYQGSFKLMVQNFIENEALSDEEIDEIKQMIDEVRKND